MEKKLPITHKEAAVLLSEFIAGNFPYCPVNARLSVPDCDCWGSDMCPACVRRHADELIGG